MDYQRLVCWGDSQTFGARTYGCYPMYLAQQLNRDTGFVWQALNLSTNGHTARNLWFRLATELGTLHDAHLACVLIGTNDVGNDTPLDLFEEYYRQVLDALHIAGFRAVFCGEIPPIWTGAHAFFAEDCGARRDDYNLRLTKVVQESRVAHLVRFDALGREDYCDPVHFRESGNVKVAQAFADAIVRF